MMMADGWWNVPKRFLPALRFTPVFPPIELSSMAINVVGIWMIGMPRMNVDATNPAVSPTTPPPSAMTHEDLSKSFSIIWLERDSTVCRVFDFSPCGNENNSAFNPAFLMLRRSFSPYNPLTFESVMMAKFLAVRSCFRCFGVSVRS